MRRMPPAIALMVLLVLFGCAPPPAASAPGEGARLLPSARLGERIYVDGPQLTPLEVIEDSRCPSLRRDGAPGVVCVWAGTVRLGVAIHLGRGDELRELTLGEPIQVADGALELVEVQPRRFADARPAPADYRFTFRFDGGL